jgi:hypothetical protein
MLLLLCIPLPDLLVGYVWCNLGREGMPCHAAGITSAESGPVPVHWNAPNGTWVTTTTSNPASPGGPVRLPSPEAAPAEASASSGMQNWLYMTCTDFTTFVVEDATIWLCSLLIHFVVKLSILQCSMCM